MKKLEITLVKSLAGTPEWMRVIVRTMALRKLHKTVVVPDNGAMRGMVKKVSHLVTCKEVEG